MVQSNYLFSKPIKMAPKVGHFHFEQKLYLSSYMQWQSKGEYNCLAGFIHQINKALKNSTLQAFIRENYLQDLEAGHKANSSKKA